MEESTDTVKQQASVTVLPEMLEFNLLLHTVMLWSSDQSPSQ
jgi:hypothetical protein